MSYIIIGHRGNKENYTENTLAGFKSALEIDNINGIELDVVVSRDKQLFISHDLFLKYNGQIVFFHTLDYKQILALSNDKSKYPLLDDTLALFGEYNENASKIILIELKSWPAFDHIALITKPRIEEIHAMLDKYGIIQKSYLISFDYRLLQDSHVLNPDVRTGLILQRNLLPLVPLIHSLNISLLVMERSWITAEQVKEMQVYMIDIFAWAPNDTKEWTRLETLGVAGIITDKPKTLGLFKKVSKK